jgi:hypothetical protein
MVSDKQALDFEASLSLSSTINRLNLIHRELFVTRLTSREHPHQSVVHIWEVDYFVSPHLGV